MWSCPPAITLKSFEMEGFLCVLGALCGSTAMFGINAGIRDWATNCHETGGGDAI